MSIVLTKGTDDEDTTEFAYVACAYACDASENQAEVFWCPSMIFFTKKILPNWVLWNNFAIL